ncbi:CHAD domain-containing protein [Pseudonocardia halophobica]|uniref:CHAD domain-containing protein n=1 Tax=Pseudonocardia halophobica TaxID=29401 RepID=UPI003D8DB9EA
MSRVLGDRLPARSRDSGEGKRRKPTSAQVVLGYVSDKVDVLRAHDPLVRLETPDAVHRMRVSARRVRSVLQGYRRVLDREATRELVGDLRWLGGELAAARDAEVTEAPFQEAVDALPAEAVLGPVSAELTRRFARERADGQRRAVAALDSDRYLLLQERLDALLTTRPRRGRGPRRRAVTCPGPCVRRTGARRVAWRPRQVQRRDASVTSPCTRPVRPRSGCYVLEAAEQTLGKKATRLRKRVKGVQSSLGDHHDAVVARPVLRELGGRARLDGADGFTFGVLHGLEQERADRLEAELVPAWERVTLPAKLEGAPSRGQQEPQAGHGRGDQQRHGQQGVEHPVARHPASVLAPGERRMTSSVPQHAMGARRRFPLRPSS